MKRMITRILVLLACLTATNSAFAQPANAPTATLSGSVGSLTTTAVRTLSADTVYKVVDFFNIFPGSALIIPAGTRLEGDPGQRASIQTLRQDTVGGTIRPSGVLIANGTAQRPIVFTSSAPDGSKQRGNIGGIVLNGVARNNAPGGTRIGEGGAGPGGGQNDADSSGSLSYVRVEFGGIQIATGNEINGFTFNGVGSRTRLEYLQAHFIADDAFEWFGGTVNAKYLVASGCDDDQIDTEFGYRGKLQFVAAVEDTAAANRGYESNNDGTGTSLTPFTKYVAYNVTMIGGSRRQANNEINDGIYIRANVGGLHYNHLIANFGASGIVVDGTVTRDNLYASETSDSGLAVKNSIFWVKNRVDGADTRDNGNPIFAIRRGSGISGLDTAGLFPLYAASANNRVVNPQLTSVNFTQPINGTAPDLRPQAGSPALTGGATPPNDGFFDVTATYIGAFGATNNWMAGWTNWQLSATPRLSSSENASKVIREFKLSQNYPNPFNPTTTIEFSLNSTQEVSLKVFDVLGREVATLVNERRAAGSYRVNFDASTLSSGTYFYRLQAGDVMESKKMMLVK
jgi:hypothetical protein